LYFPSFALPLVLTYKNQKGNYQLVGKTKEGKYKKVYSDIFEIDEYYFSGTAKFTQRVKIINPKLKNIDVFADGQACIDGRCVQTTSNLKFTLPVIKVTETATTETTDSVSKPTDSVATTETDTTKQTVAPVKDTNIEKPADKEEKSLWTIFFLAFLFISFIHPQKFFDWRFIGISGFILSILLMTNGINAILGGFEMSAHITITRGFFKQYFISSARESDILSSIPRRVDSSFKILTVRGSNATGMQHSKSSGVGLLCSVFILFPFIYSYL
jgi:thiol:disulfide interchange protein DsbD